MTAEEFKLLQRMFQNQVVIGQKLDQLTAMVQILVKGEKGMALDISKLLAAVAEETTETASLIQLCNTLGMQLQSISEQLAGQPAIQAQIDQVTALLTADQAKIVAAVKANTPAAPPAAPPAETPPVSSAPASPAETPAPASPAPAPASAT